MIRFLTILCYFSCLAGCAAPSGQMATCTNLISTGGGLLQFCQTDNKLKVSEAGVDADHTADDVTIVNDPAVLSALERDLRLRPELKTSRKLVARACLVKGTRYVSIASDDLTRILATRTTQTSPNTSTVPP